MLSEYFEVLRRIAQPIRASSLPHTLEHIHRLLDALGNPQTHYGSLVVAGSTGKGTTCLRLAETLCNAGFTVGLYTSPHLHSFRERIALLDSTMPTPSIIPPDAFVRMAKRALAAEEKLNHPYSTFETTTALALAWFAEQRVDVAVLEVGIGGRFDAVNAVPNRAAVFTPIEAEHLAMLGGSVETIAWHKAGIMRVNGQAFSVPQRGEVIAVLQREADEKQATLKIDPDLLAAAEVFTPSYRQPPAPRAKLQLAGRLERCLIGGHQVIIDGGHTASAAQHLRQFVRAQFQPPIRMIVGMLRDKDTAGYLRPFDEPDVHFVYTQAPGDRALTPDEIYARYLPAQTNVSLVPLLAEALRLDNAPVTTPTVIAGSLRMAAAAREAYGLLSAEALEEARLTRAIFEGEDYLNKLR